MRQTDSLLLLVILACSTTAVATDYFVDNSGTPRCRNRPANGSAEAPWCTINYGLSRIGDGDTLYVKAGTYRENVLIEGPSGTASNPTVIRTFPGHAVTIIGDGFHTGRVRIARTRHLVFDGFTITNFNQGLFIDDSHYITIQNLTVHDIGQEGIRVRQNSSFITIQNNTVHDTRRWQFNGEGIYIGTGSRGPKDNTNNVLIRHNTIYNTWDEAIELKPGTHACIVDGNVIFNATLNPDWPVMWGAIEVNQARAGLQSWESDPGHIVRNNIVHSSKTAIRAGTGTTVYNNLIYNTPSPYLGIYVDSAAGDSYPRLVYHNTVDLPASRAVVVKSGTTADVRNNIGPASQDNLASSQTFYVNHAEGDYRLVPGGPPIDAGVDLTEIVSVDILGNSRSAHLPPDLGAYEFIQP